MANTARVTYEGGLQIDYPREYNAAADFIDLFFVRHLYQPDFSNMTKIIPKLPRSDCLPRFLATTLILLISFM